jgi:hypothetical protein
MTRYPDRVTMEILSTIPNVLSVKTTLSPTPAVEAGIVIFLPILSCDYDVSIMVS